MGEKENYQRLSGSRCAICAIVVILVVLYFVESERMKPNDTSPVEGNSVYANNNRLAKYCSAPFSGNEGNKVDLNLYDLVSITLTIRHGDRSSIHQVPGEVKKYIKPIQFTPIVKSALNQVMRMFTIKTLGGGSESDYDFKHSLDKPKLFDVPDTELSQGQLTSTGFSQWLNIGLHLQLAYSGFLSRIISTDQVYIRSTNYARTIQSVSALGFKFLPTIPNSAYTIQVKADEREEIMHGIGLKLSSHQVDSKGEKHIEGDCKKATNYAVAEKEAFAPTKSVTKDLVRIFGGQLSNRFMTDTVDSFLPRYCHNLPLPCGPSECASETLLQAMMSDADRVFCDRYTGIHGGFNATRMSIYPFMRDVIESLNPAHVQSNSHPKIHIYSGHDTVISPVLAALGVYKGEHCVWPPLASHIVFELWRRKDFSISEKSSYKYWVRILFNGEDIVPTMSECQQVHWTTDHVAAQPHPPLQLLCPYDIIEKLVHNLISPHPTIGEACV